MMRKHNAILLKGGPVFERILAGGGGTILDTWKCADCGDTFVFDAPKTPKACPCCGIPIYGWIT